MANKEDENTIIISSHILEPSIAISDHIWILGNEFDGDRKIEGSTIRYTEDLAAQGLAWTPEIRKEPRFHDMIEKVRDIFHTI